MQLKSIRVHLATGITAVKNCYESTRYTTDNCGQLRYHARACTEYRSVRVIAFLVVARECLVLCLCDIQLTAYMDMQRVKQTG